MCADEAKEYLKNYSITKENSLGKEYTIQYTFNSEEDLDKAAAYIARNGISKFNEVLAAEITEAMKAETENAMIMPISTSPSTAYETVSTDGNHYVSAEAYGLASFDSLGTVEYLVELGYRVTVSNGKFTNLTNISFDIPYISAAGSWGNTSFPSHCFDYNCGVTANYVITKTIEVGLGDFSIGIKSETDSDFFALLTSIV